MDALADIEGVPAWSPLHKHTEVVDRHPDGRPHHVKATFRIMGITDKELLEYHWGDDWMVWDATNRRPAQYMRNNLIGLPRDKALLLCRLLNSMASDGRFRSLAS